MLLFRLTYLLSCFRILDIPEVDTPTLLATSATETPCLFTNPIAIRSRTPLISLRGMPALNSQMHTIFLYKIYTIGNIADNPEPSNSSHKYILQSAGGIQPKSKRHLISPTKHSGYLHNNFKSY
jgi:hypothetical protein